MNKLLFGLQLNRKIDFDKTCRERCKFLGFVRRKIFSEGEEFELYRYLFSLNSVFIWLSSTLNRVWPFNSMYDVSEYPWIVKTKEKL